MRKAQIGQCWRQSGTIFEWSGFEFYELSCWILLVEPSGPNILRDISITLNAGQAECGNEGHNDECRYADCRYADSRGTMLSNGIKGKKTSCLMVRKNSSASGGSFTRAISN